MPGNAWSAAAGTTAVLMLDLALPHVYFRTTGSPYVIWHHVHVTLAYVAEYRLALIAQAATHSHCLARHQHAIMCSPGGSSIHQLFTMYAQTQG